MYVAINDNIVIIGDVPGRGGGLLVSKVSIINGLTNQQQTDAATISS